MSYAFACNISERNLDISQVKNKAEQDRITITYF